MVSVGQSSLCAKFHSNSSTYVGIIINTALAASQHLMEGAEIGVLY